MGLGQWFAVAILFLSLLAIGLQCQVADHHGGRSQRNRRLLRSETTTPRSANDNSRMPYITSWPADSNNPFGYRSESAPDINKSERDGEATENSTNETDTASPTISTSHYHARLRDRQARIFSIQMDILRKLGLRRQPNVSFPFSPSAASRLPLEEHFNAGQPVGSDNLLGYDEEDVVQRYQFLRPSCDLPRRSDITWHDGNAFRLLFKLSSSMNNPNIGITSAFLRLFKKAIPGCNCQSGGSSRSRLRRARNGRRRRQGETRVHRGYEETERIRISVFQYNKPVKRGKRERKRLIDSIMVERSSEGWQTLDIKQSVTSWIKNPNSNFGLLVQVEDMEQTELDSTKVFGTLNCSANASLPIVPLNPILLDGGIPMPSQNQSAPFLELRSIQSFAPSYRKRREAPSKCELKHKMISLYDLGVSSASLEDQIKIGYCEGSCGLDSSGKQSSCRATTWETKTLSESSQGGSTDLSVYNKHSATSCSCHQVSRT